jgi:outer membrane receptor for ferrienterochelin and colicins
MSRPAAALVAATCLALLPSLARGQETVGTVVVRVRAGSAPVRSVVVSAAGVSAETDARGEARLALPAGAQELLAQRDGFAPATAQVTVPAGGIVEVVVRLREQRFEETVTVVAATRSGTMIEDQVIRVEALPQEEIEENSTLAPGNLTTLLNEIGGLQVQTTSPALGGANLRLQGLPGRYTTILSDELPLYGEQPDAFALLQVPPLDLAQAEVIKGATSALYGGGGLGGLVNLVSRRPDGEPEILLSQTDHGGTDAVAFVPGALGAGWGYTLLGSIDRQVERDGDGDGWADLAGYRRGVVRPRLFWDDEAGHSLFVTLGGSEEHRKGGIVDGSLTPGGSSFEETLDTGRRDAGLVGRFVVGADRLIALHASYASVRADHRFGGVRERDVRSFGFTELNLSGSDHGHTWVLGGALSDQRYRFEDAAGFDSTSTTPAVFVQDEYSPTRRFSLSANVRADFAGRFGTIVNTRASALVRPGRGWSLRLSAGTGHSLPVPVLDETDAVGLSRVLPPHDLAVERAFSASFDTSWSGGPFEIAETLFASRVRDPLLLRSAATAPDRFEIANSAIPTEAYGSQSLVRYKRGLLQIIATHTYLHSAGSDAERETPLTPRHSAELAALFEEESRGRVGVEVSYTGRQALEANPYRRESPPYTEVNVLGEVRFGEIRLFVNGVNLTDVRQTDFDPLLLPQRAPDGRWTTDLWGPLEGRSFNAGVRLEF